MSAFLQMKNIVKQFPGVRANDNVNFEVEAGEVHTLLGENGAGKSTLMSILYGLYQPTSGEIYLKGKRVEITSPKVAIELGIGMVHQHFMLIPALTVVENVILGMKSDKGAVLDLEGAAKKITALSRQYNMDIDPWAKVWQLSVGQQQRLEIIKALYRGADLLILDEPTAVLTPQEVEELFVMMRKLTQEGHTVIFISHKLDEIMTISQRVTVLRAGKSVATVNTKDTDKQELARLMVGRDVFLRFDKKPCCPGQPVLEMQGVECLNNKGLKALKQLSLTVCAGEVLGIAGVDGNGQSELVETITGLRKVTAGTVKVNGQDVTNKPPREILEHKVAHIPEDRHKRGLVMGMSIKENVMLMSYYKKPFANGLFLDWKYIENFAEELVEQYNVKTPGIEVLAKNLSGGNQQKVILGREISREPNLLIAMHPTRGLDIGATEYVHKRIIQERDRGCGVLLVSTELEEILSLSDRIAVMYGGEIMGIVDAKNANIEELGLMMAGTKQVAC
ncbi:ABC transporter ATP-binding protein [Zhaonella formicivorans]|uniref:ABC transporter ATP-binding protein n=1 Tax=Zhaonella formicivorans TaxID=2528593 RepID=UPI001D101E67|nr:ABC transporter ATP-binding protein [Zhaonella formicivorans]